jgi:predicted glycosyltransferase
VRLIVYSHDAFGLGNIRRMLAICKHLLAAIPQVSILVLSGSPAIQNFQIPARLDYIKLPCLARDTNGKLRAKYLSSDVTETVKLRSNLIKTAILDFQPDLILVDKKPYGLLGELKPTLDIIKTYSPQTKLVLLLRDILDAPEVTIQEWQSQGYYQAVQHYYDRVLVVGMAEVFNLVQEYQFPQIAAEKTTFCGYLEKDFVKVPATLIRRKLGLKKRSDKLIVVTPGGGEDGSYLIENYLAALPKIRQHHNCKTLIILGSEMATVDRDKLVKIMKKHPDVTFLRFTNHLMNYLQAADLVISMAGYNTITEILSLNKKAVVIPRCQPSQEQLIRAFRMMKLGLLEMIAPDLLTKSNLSNAIVKQLNNQRKFASVLKFDGLVNIQQEIRNILTDKPNFTLVTSQEQSGSYSIMKKAESRRKQLIINNQKLTTN